MRKENIFYTDPCDERRMLSLYMPESNRFPLFIFIHGGGLEDGDKTDIDVAAKYLIRKGIAVASVNYRMYPEAKYPEFIEDCAEAVSWICNNIGNYGECSRIFIGGSSAGAYISMMLCFNKSYLSKYRLDPDDFAGFLHDAGQPTCHFNVLRERGLDTRRVIVDESAPLYYVGTGDKYPPMRFIVSDNDIECRYEQTKLVTAVLKQFGADRVEIEERHGRHCEYIESIDEDSESVYGKMIYDFMKDKI